jgi:aconitate hydratase
MTGLNTTQKIIKAHLTSGDMTPGEEIALKIDQTLTQDATGTMVMLALEALRLDRVKTELSAQYVDHNLIQADNKNADDHLFLESACQRYGIWYSRPGNGVSHPLHMQRFGAPGKTLLGSDSHTPAAGSIGMLAIGAGGFDVAMAMAGEPYYFRMPKVWGIRLTGKLPHWVSAKDVILEMLRRHDVDGGVGRAIEYYGPGLASLSAMDRHVIANMGTELGATTTIFPSDDEVRRFLELEGRAGDWREILRDEDSTYEHQDEIDLSSLEPLIALPSSPGHVLPVREVMGKEIYQSYIGSSANPGYRDFAICAHMVKGRKVPDVVSFDINPTSRQLLATLTADARLNDLLKAGARLHQTGCNGCIGMGQAPATGRISLRTVPRNFPGRSGTKEDSVYLCSPETATASALAGKISDPRDIAASLGIEWPEDLSSPVNNVVDVDLLTPPLEAEKARQVQLIRGPNIDSLPEMAELPDRLDLPILLKVGDNVSTDEILPAGARVLPFRSNIPKIAQFAFETIDDTYAKRAHEILDSAQDKDRSGHIVVGGKNYGQGSSREHAAIAPRYVGLRVVIAKSFARIHKKNLTNFGILPLEFANAKDYDCLVQGQVVRFEDLRDVVKERESVDVEFDGRKFSFKVHLSKREREYVLAGGHINEWRRGKRR